MNIDYVWEAIQPYVVIIGGVVSAGASIYSIVRVLVGRFIKKINLTLERYYNVEATAQIVAEKLATKTINIDLTAVTEKALKKTSKALDVRIEKVENAANSLKCINIAMAKGMMHLKAMSEEEKAELANAIRTLEAQYKPPEVAEVMTVRLQPIVLNQESIGDGPTNDEESGVNFGGLDE